MGLFFPQVKTSPKALECRYFSTALFHRPHGKQDVFFITNKTFLIQMEVHIYEVDMTPWNLKLKIGSKEPEDRQNLTYARRLL